MASKITTFKLDEKTTELVAEIGKLTGAKNGHEALRDGLRLAWLVLQYKRMKKAQRANLSLEEFLDVAGRCF